MFCASKDGDTARLADASYGRARGEPGGGDLVESAAEERRVVYKLREQLPLWEQGDEKLATWSRLPRTSPACL